MRRQRDWRRVALAIIALAILIWALCPKKPGHPVPAIQHDPLGEIHHDAR